MNVGIARLSEPIRPVDRGAEGESGDGANTGVRHQLPGGGLRSHVVDYTLSQLGKLRGHHRGYRHQRLDQTDQYQVIGGQIAISSNDTLLGE